LVKLRQGIIGNGPYFSIQGFAVSNVTKIYPDPIFASNSAGRPLSWFGALSQIVSVSPSGA
jgi:hypothetical protein